MHQASGSSAAATEEIHVLSPYAWWGCDLDTRITEGEVYHTIHLSNFTVYYDRFLISCLVTSDKAFVAVSVPPPLLLPTPCQETQLLTFVNLFSHLTDCSRSLFVHQRGKINSAKYLWTVSCSYLQKALAGNGMHNRIFITVISMFLELFYE